MQATDVLQWAVFSSVAGVSVCSAAWLCMHICRHICEDLRRVFEDRG